LELRKNGTTLGYSTPKADVHLFYLARIRTKYFYKSLFAYSELRLKELKLPDRGGGMLVQDIKLLQAE
jgi:hypothetical protein